MRLLIKKVLRKIGLLKIQEKTESTSKWLKIKGGPLKDHYMFLNLSAPASWHKEMVEGCYDDFLYNIIKKILTIEDSNVWDVGAHVGYHSLAFASLVGPKGHVIAIEPNPYNVDRLRKNLKRNSDLIERITLLTCALSNSEGEADFLFSSEIDDGRSSGSHLKQSYMPEGPESYISFSQTKVPVTTADKLIISNKLLAPDVIKIDVEGAESLVLEGAHQLLLSKKPVLLIEVHHIIAMHDTLKILFELNYRTSVVNEAPSSMSRCFIVAQPGN